MRVRRPPALIMAEGRSQSPPLSPSAVPGARTHDDMQDVDSEAQRAAAPATLYRERVKWSWDSVASLFDEAGAVRSVNFDNLDTSEVKGDDDDERMDQLETERETCARVEQGASESGLQDDLLAANDVLKHQVEKATDAFVAESVQLVEACEDAGQAPLWGAVFGRDAVPDLVELPSDLAEEGAAAAATVAAAAGHVPSETNQSSEASVPYEGERHMPRSAPPSSSRARFRKPPDLGLLNLATVANVHNIATAAAD